MRGRPLVLARVADSPEGLGRLALSNDERIRLATLAETAAKVTAVGPGLAWSLEADIAVPATSGVQVEMYFGNPGGSVLEWLSLALNGNYAAAAAASASMVSGNITTTPGVFAARARNGGVSKVSMRIGPQVGGVRMVRSWLSSSISTADQGRVAAEVSLGAITKIGVRSSGGNCIAVGSWVRAVVRDFREDV